VQLHGFRPRILEPLEILTAATGIAEESSSGLGALVSHYAKQARTRKMIRELRSLGYLIELPTAPTA
jgi:hypothetical protein